MTKQKPGNVWLSTSENLTYRLGRIMQDQTVNEFADMGKAICHWRCVSCRHLHEFQSRPFKCAVCKVTSFTPEEVRFQSAVSGASCGVDMLLALGEAKLRPIELKTMDEGPVQDARRAARRAPAAHNLYLRIIAEMHASLGDHGRDGAGERPLHLEVRATAAPTRS